jgi:crotonobetainyl-CoA:carnitine CoA-transferase CaiB-like acyl-CoA transferase
MAGLTIVELANERGDWAGKLLADTGAEVIKVEPPTGDATRRYAPFLDDEQGGDLEGERSLYFWHNNTSKRGVTLDLDRKEGRALFVRLVESADMLIESEPPGRMAALGLDYPDLQPSNAGLIMVSITPFGRDMPRSGEAATDLTLFAGPPATTTTRCRRCAVAATRPTRPGATSR